MTDTIKTTKNKAFERGNAMIYVLVALALFGFLTMTMSRQGNQSDGQNLNDEQAGLYANELMSYVASAQNVVDMMISTGSDVNELNFVNPTSAAFDTPPHIHKVFHPQGGGLNYQENISDSIGVAAQNSNWIISSAINVEWTPTSANDTLLAAKGIKQQICEGINNKIFGNNTIPQFTADDLSSGLTAVICPECEGYPNFCAQTNTGSKYVYYSIIVAR